MEPVIASARVKNPIKKGGFLTVAIGEALTNAFNRALCWFQIKAGLGIDIEYGPDGATVSLSAAGLSSLQQQPAATSSTGGGTTPPPDTGGVTTYGDDTIAFMALVTATTDTSGSTTYSADYGSGIVGTGITTGGTDGVGNIFVLPETHALVEPGGTMYVVPTVALTGLVTDAVGTWYPAGSYPSGYAVPVCQITINPVDGTATVVSLRGSFTLVSCAGVPIPF
jgi:hypothetical protein